MEGNTDRGNVGDVMEPNTPIVDLKGGLTAAPRKTPVLTMSSSLKERLKKCGRYHPATPTSGLHSNPLSRPTNTSSNQQSNPQSHVKYSPLHSSTNNLQFQYQPRTPLTSMKTCPLSSMSRAGSVGFQDVSASEWDSPSHSQDYSHSTSSFPQSTTPLSTQQKRSACSRLSVGGKRKLPQPRNILKEKSNACVASEILNTQHSLGDSVAVSGNVNVSESDGNADDDENRMDTDLGCGISGDGVRDSVESDEARCGPVVNSERGNRVADDREKRRRITDNSQDNTDLDQSLHMEIHVEVNSSHSAQFEDANKNPAPPFGVKNEYDSDIKLDEKSRSGVETAKKLPADQSSIHDCNNPGGAEKCAAGPSSQRKSECVSSSPEVLAACSRDLSRRLAERQEVLRKLNMVKIYRAKHDLDHLQSLIDKWRSVCQQAVLDLHQLTPDPRPSLTQLVQQLGLDKELVGYDDVEESFESF